MSCQNLGKTQYCTVQHNNLRHQLSGFSPVQTARTERRL